MTADEAQEMIDDVRSAEGAVTGGIRLSKWESDFVESCEERLDEGEDLTPKQSTKLEEIWERI